MSPYNVLVVDDSIFMRKMISDLISEDPAFRVIDTAKNGKEALEKIKTVRPDVVTMDVEMPIMNGLEALQQIMKENPTPVIMLSSLTQEGAAETIRALELGAVDFVRKPSGSISLDIYKVRDALLDKLRLAVKTNMKKMSPNVVQAPPPSIIKPSVEASPLTQERSIRFNHLVAIGTSTGGPRALHQVLSHIPANFAAPIVVVQHMPPNFTKSLAQRLDSVSAIRVVEAEDGLPLQSGTAYIAPGGMHMVVVRDGTKAYRVRLTKDEPRSGHRPSVDMLFESLLPLTELQRHIVLMTGMGSDGAKGMAALKRSGAVTTIAESEESCIVYGMPRAAVELQCVTDILPQHLVAQKLSLVVSS
ncbi:protein-glutamate methylesterase/protein-glutamine glutaminase [Paenibacillus thalictri]|uniref:Protein-glutamate methylesterase/protein-glutamine glutaminase n=1 Tax=Paenibacillus thalictri TaxID=2527873 RepID=A0A4Q9DRG9_9BACL|nr:chemotaxis response regulator protein-glutamate methylesterase [Paenibacillus thalictri]TBL77747.1 chemotaxis response regulator protein-glutamate methylesterase [Paenibacillus thalictri]